MQVQVLANRVVKYNASVLAALLITFLLFYFMQYLITTRGDALPSLSITRVIDSTVPEFENTLLENIEPPAPLEEYMPPEFETPVRQNELGAGILPSLPWTAPATPQLSVGGIPLASNIMIPLIRTAANYPARALSRGIEGFVELTFTVDELGNVRDAVVLYAEPEGYFERAALQSIEKWKYAAAMEKGEPVATHDVRQRIVFQIDPTSR